MHNVTTVWALKKKEKWIRLIKNSMRRETCPVSMTSMMYHLLVANYMYMN